MNKKTKNLFSVRAQIALEQAGLTSLASIRRLTPTELRKKVGSRKIYEDILQVLGQLQLAGQNPKK